MTTVLRCLCPPKRISRANPKRTNPIYEVRCDSCARVYEAVGSRGKIEKQKYCKKCQPRHFQNRRIALIQSRRALAVQHAKRQERLAATLPGCDSAKDPMSQKRGLTVPGAADPVGSISGEPVHGENGLLAHGDTALEGE